jgi:hypothetical protein
MFVDKGVLIAEAPSEYPEAAERLLGDRSLAMLYTPNMVSADGCAEMERHWEARGKDRQRSQSNIDNVLAREVEILPEVNRAIEEWVKRNHKLWLHPYLVSPKFDGIRGGGIKPHIDSDSMFSKRGPLVISISTTGEAAYSAERPAKDTVNFLGLTSFSRTRQLVSRAAMHHQAIIDGEKEDLPVTQLQKKSDGIWIPGFPTPAIHRVRALLYNGEPGVTIRRAAAIFDYKLAFKFAPKKYR